MSRPSKKTIADVCEEIAKLRSEVAKADEFRSFQSAMELFKDEVNKKFKEKDDEISKLQDRVAVLQSGMSSLKRASNASEQYSRRTTLRFHRVKAEAGEKAEGCLAKIVEVLDNPDVDLDIPKAVVDRAHRVGVSRNGKPPAIICKFATFRHRTLVYRKRAEIKAKFGYTVSLDLTKSNLQLLDSVRALIASKELDDGVYAFADVNCQPTLKCGEEFFRFNTLEEARAKLEIDDSDEEDEESEEEEEVEVPAPVAQEGAEPAVAQ